MIKKLISVIFFLLLIVVLGVIAIAYWIDPNYFKGFITDTVKKETGYELTIKDDLRWRIWPNMSIISNGIKLAAPNAKEPVLTAENMRLDVKLLPLLSKKLEIKNVFVKSAIFSFSDDSKKINLASKQAMTINDHVVNAASAKSDNNWSFSIKKLHFVDSIVVLKNSNKTINFRDIDLLLTEQAPQKLNMVLSGHIERNLNDLAYSINANIDFKPNFDSLLIQLNQFDYKLTGVNFPKDGIEGSALGNIDFARKAKQLHSNDFVFKLGKNAIKATFDIDYHAKPEYNVRLQAARLDLTPFEGQNDGKATNDNIAVLSINEASPKNKFAFLQDFNGNLVADVDTLIAHSQQLNHVHVKANNKQALLTIERFDADFAGGQIALTGAARGDVNETDLLLSGSAKGLNLQQIYAAFQAKQADLQGDLTLSGHVNVHAFNPQNLFQSLSGNIKFEMNQVSFLHLNLEELLKTSFERVSHDAIAFQDKITEHTTFDHLEVESKIKNGVLTLHNLVATSKNLDAKGAGSLNIAMKNADMNLQLILKELKTNNNALKHLQGTPIPLRIYGPFDALHYELDVNDLLKNVLSDKSKVNELLDKIQDKVKDVSDKDDVKKLKNKVKDFFDKLK